MISRREVEKDTPKHLRNARKRAIEYTRRWKMPVAVYIPLGEIHRQGLTDALLSGGEIPTHRWTRKTQAIHSVGYGRGWSDLFLTPAYFVEHRAALEAALRDAESKYPGWAFELYVKETWCVLDVPANGYIGVIYIYKK